MNRFWGAIGALLLLALPGCVQHKPYDYSALRESKPKSILVLPAVNKSVEVKAAGSLLSQVTYPLSESGYYVYPVAVVEETFRQNGMTEAQDIHNLSYKKLYEIFGADSALYLNITEYGTQYRIINSDTRVSATARLVDLHTGKALWSGVATASSTENDNHDAGGLVGMLISAAISQISNTVMDKSHDIAGITSNRLLSAGGNGHLLYGPRSALYGKDQL
ncbi:DUF799 domain-containing protein [Xenorhabdus nematophila]|uniref:Lipoprotein n=1 Tax=Xenorhabdus nematophila (strain ATCC 19061 / DSM 3370 / CCUG 14189 / LMG 1036 / NCIMB 9965 / AN6) TaxID=406817 RepID=D3VLQ9_XENNA|nr:DUF799 domain-containing protein [Xenorhabdus nematophila]CEE90488.1 Putative lipoprotein [Xenorhabdus nematophila str. Anatoliense]CEF28604.1 Putative lipoprotein [Xenorhabdus nematophila str. Websteri]AYA39236.1 hypothetical protein D3790_00935 [Xenorhabdus nematophila]KHD27520.1 lipoprotein [Xenorhabdus nematophila]MBA0017816.1 DUF799 domain-containing protein [Xenorhabdus nematophila]